MEKKNQKKTSEDFFEMNMPWVESPFFSSILKSKSLSEENKKIAQDFNKNGYVIIENTVSDEQIEKILSETKGLYNPKEEDGPRSKYRVQDAWEESKAVGDLCSDKKMLDTLRMLYDREPIPFQSLNFLYGTEQQNHSDAIHFSCIPRGFMCGIWVALEDITEENGPLFYYPGSHLLPEYNLYDLKYGSDNVRYDQYLVFLEKLMKAHGIEKQVFTAKKGSALIWASNLVHGGSPITSKKEDITRVSQVTHYYFEDCIYTTPIFSNFVTGEWALKDITDIRTKEKVEHKYNGKTVYNKLLEGSRHKISFDKNCFEKEAIDNKEIFSYSPNLPETNTMGYVDQMTKKTINGWATYLKSEKMTQVELIINDKLIDSMNADEFRQDVQQNGIHKSGYCGFTFKLKKNLKRGDKVKVRVTGEQEELTNSNSIF